ncbi:MAG: ferritin [Syntrophaceae bacterium]|nr:ferritin [Syntrophaceae bacterium]
MISQKIQDAFNEQINAETYSAYLYLSMAAYFASINLDGFATWMRVQAQEELLHAMKFFDYINERGGNVNLKPIDGPPTRWDSPIAAFQEAYRHEQKVTGLINNLVDISLQERDHASNAFLQWFVTEQVEEEASADAVVQKLKLAGDHGGGLFMIDRELGARVFAYPATTAQE